MATIDVKDATGATQTLEKPNGNGRATAANSRPIVLSNEDLAAIAAIVTALGSPFQAGGSIGNTTFGAAQSGAWSLTNVSGTVSLPTGAATEATLALLNTDVTATGSITTQNLVPAGAATANSAVELTMAGRAGLTIQTTGTYTGALSIQATLDGSVWVTLAGAPMTNINTGTYSTTIPSAATSIYIANAMGYNKVRVTGLAAMTGTATVTLRGSMEVATAIIGNALPTGSNAIGALSAGSSLIGGVGLMVGSSTNTSAQAPSRYPLSSAATTNGNLIAAGARRLIGGQLANTTAALKYVKFYNKATAPTVGTDTPVLTIVLQPNATESIADIVSVYGQQVPLGLGIGITGAWADNDTTAVAAGDVLVNALYI